jgi:Ni/Fe-hydrogenase subunit HybB-like protein
MTHIAAPAPVTAGEWLRAKLFLGMRPAEYLRSLIRPWNAVPAAILAVGLPVTFLRFTHGLGAVTHLSDANPWGIWIGIDVLCGVALAAGGFVIGSAVHLFGLEDYKPLVRPAVLTGFLGYALVVVGLAFDLGRPWRLPYPMVVSFGTSSVMFEVGWCVALYLLCQLVEMFPPIFAWLGWERLRAWAARLMIGTTVAAVVLSTLHQSSLGALFLIAPGKLHPLWYGMYLPVFFLISAVAGGIGMIVIESALSHRYFRRQVAHHDPRELQRLTLGLGKAGAVVLFAYFWLKWVGVAHENQWSWLATPLGGWWLVEVLGFVLLPCLIFTAAVRRRSVPLVRVGAVLTVLGVILNRLNVSVIAFNWNRPVRYYPHWMEITVTVTIVTIGVLVFKWMVNRMPILLDAPPAETRVERTR